MALTVVTGGSGRLGTALRPYFSDALFPTRAELDVANPNSINRYFSARSVGCIVHLAAETRYDAPWDLLVRTNIVGTAQIALVAQKQGARCVYTSTDYVYPGLTGGYREDSPVAPVGRYGLSKYGGEASVAPLDNACIIRGSWYAALAWDVGAVDAYTSRVPVSVAAHWVATLARSTVTGVWNVGGTRRSFYEIGVSEGHPRLRPVSRTELKLPYPLPPDSSVDTTKMRAYGLR